jgi:hypothetical protein
MESPVSLEGVASHVGAVGCIGSSASYHVKRFGGVVRLTGRDGTQTCLLEDCPPGRSGTGAGFLRDRPLYTLGIAGKGGHGGTELRALIENPVAVWRPD